MRKPIFLGARDQAAIPGVNRVFSSKNCECFLFENENFPRNTPFVLDPSKQLLVVQIPEVTVYQENVEHIRLITFH